MTVRFAAAAGLAVPCQTVDPPPAVAKNEAIATGQTAALPVRVQVGCVLAAVPWNRYANAPP